MEDLVLVRHGTLSLSPLYSRSSLSYGRDYAMELSRTSPADIQRDTSRTNKKPGRFSFIPYWFEEIDLNLETRASGEVGVDPPHYVGVDCVPIFGLQHYASRRRGNLGRRNKNYNQNTSTQEGAISQPSR